MSTRTHQDEGTSGGVVRLREEEEVEDVGAESGSEDDDRAKRQRFEDVPEWIRLLKEHELKDITAPTHTHYISTSIDVHEALEYMLETDNNILAVFDEEAEEYVSFLSLLDICTGIVQSLRDLHLNVSDYKDIATLFAAVSGIDHANVLNVTNLSRRTPFCHIDGDLSLYDAVRLMVRLQSRCVVVDPVNPRPASPDAELGTMLTQKTVVRFLHSNLHLIPSLSRRTVNDILKMKPSLKRLFTVTVFDTAMEAFELMTRFSISALPVLDSDGDGSVVGMISVDDIKLIVKNTSDLVLLFKPISDLLALIRQKNQIVVSNVVSVSPEETFGIVVSKLVENDVHRVVVCDGDGSKLLGMITMGSILDIVLSRK